jgi:hypothetical protein
MGGNEEKKGALNEWGKEREGGEEGEGICWHNRISQKLGCFPALPTSKQNQPRGVLGNKQNKKEKKKYSKN